MAAYTGRLYIAEDQTAIHFTTDCVQTSNGVQAAAIADFPLIVGISVDADARAKINLILAALRGVGIIDT